MGTSRRLVSAASGADPRTLALVRMGLAACLGADAAGHVGASSLGWVALVAASAALLAVGQWARLGRVAALLGVIALHRTEGSLLHGGHAALCLLAWWVLLLPVGRRFSVDAVTRSLASRREVSAEGLEETARLSRDTTMTASPAAFALLAQFVHANFAAAIRVGSPAALASLGVGTLLALVPVGSVWLAPVGMSVAIATHIAVIPVHGDPLFAMVAAATSLGALRSRHWEALEQWASAPARRIVVHFDGDCGICFAAARLLVRLDAFQRIDVVPTSARRDLPDGFDPALLDDTMLVVERVSKRYFVRSRALARIVEALPVGWLGAWLLRLPGFGSALDRLYDRLAKNRAIVSAYVGFAACGTGAFGGETTVHEPSVLRELVHEKVERVRDAVGGAIVVLAVLSFVVPAGGFVARVAEGAGIAPGRGVPEGRPRGVVSSRHWRSWVSRLTGRGPVLRGNGDWPLAVTDRRGASC